MPPRKKPSAKSVAKNADPPLAAVSDESVEEREHVIVQLAIPQDRIDTIVKGDNTESQEPIPYAPMDSFAIENDQVPVTNNSTDFTGKVPVCYWCCHPIESMRIGMPTGHDVVHDTFTVFGTFCSLQCATAYNFATHQGSDRVWEIHSWIQLLARKMGIPTPVRPAPSKYLLQLFGGNLSIEEFREAHKTTNRTYILNLPPLINIMTQSECVNTSFMNGQSYDFEKMQGRTKLVRNRALIDYTKTLEGKMNVTT